MNTYSPDEDLENSDWTKTTWDLPPYKSAEFFAVITDLDAFRKTPVYAAAVAQGLIVDDEWLADFIQDAAPAAKTKTIHIHLE